MNTAKSFLTALALITAGQRLPAQPPAGPADAISPPAAAAARLALAAEPAEVFSLQSGGRGFARTIGTNEILTLAHTNGAKLVLHFTRIEGTNIACRWRSQSSPEAPVVTGESTLSEPYRRPSPPANNSEVVSKGEPIPLRVFNAGGLRVVWVSKAALPRWAAAQSPNSRDSRARGKSWPGRSGGFDLHRGGTGEPGELQGGGAI